MNRLKKTVVLVATLILVNFSIVPVSVYAMDDVLYDKFAENNIIFYDPNGTDDFGCPVSSSSIGGGSLPTETTQYLDNAGVKNKAEQNMPRYEHAAKEAALPWQAIAALHWREASMRREASILNGQNLGTEPYVNVDGKVIYPDDKKDALEAANHLKALAKSVYGIELTASSTLEEWGKAFLAYNRGSMYKNASPEATYDQSPYVMNWFDAAHMKMKWIRADSYNGNTKLNSVEGTTDARPGALAVMSYLGAGSMGGGCTGAISEGGLTEEQAKILMMRYGENLNDDSKNAAGSAMWQIGKYWSNVGSNCVTFSAFFMNKFSSSKPNGAYGNGNNVVGNLGKSGTATGDKPGVFSIFSVDGSSANCEGCGHTGVVLGIHGDTIITGHASYSRAKGTDTKGDGTRNGGGVGYITVGKLDDYASYVSYSVKPSYAYLNDLDIAAIERYINNGP